MAGSLQKGADSNAAAHPMRWMACFLLCRVATVDVEMGAGRELVLDEEDDAVGNLFRLAETTQGVQRDEVVDGFLAQNVLIRHADLDVARIRGIDADVVLRKCKGCGLGHEVDAALGCIVGGRFGSPTAPSIEEVTAVFPAISNKCCSFSMKMFLKRFDKP